ncbi:HPP family protein [Aureimonas glaciei]|uniref:Membrane protein n=1 Tax=Aureimonas glaciei TaxID=1776957 RepID=A0A916YBB8_9HYPH|nr:HPP family protein [Aureimonas glaciei]GGD38111.1 membrane protein [Aureimonas glaciei]
MFTPPPLPGDPPTRKPFRFFVPILAGATLRDRAIACVGAFIGICLTGFICSSALGRDPFLPFIVAPIGASAVLLFAVPASPLAQPWSIIGGNTVSALVGITVVHFVDDPMLAIGLSVALAIAAMSLTRCLHPPGGAAALTAVIGGPTVLAAGYAFAFVPIAVNSVVLVLLGLFFHRFSSHSYPHVPKAAPVNTHGTSDLPPAARVGFRAEDIQGALADLGETFDIDPQDLDRLLRRIELRSLLREHDDFSCADIMSRDVISVSQMADAEVALALLLDHGVRTLPVTDESGRLVGIVGLRELTRRSGLVGDVMAEAAISTPRSPAIELIGPLTDGMTHSVVIVDDDRWIRGLVTQTDLLSAMSRVLARRLEGA